MDADIKELVTILLKSQNNLSNQVIELTKTVDSFVASAEAYIETSQERIKFVEKQLDTIFKSITIKNGGKENA